MDRVRDVPARGPLDPARRPSRRRALGEPPQPLLARAGHVDRQRDPGLCHRRGRQAPRRRAPVPRLARLPGGGRVPRAARAGHAEGAARRAQRRLRPRHARRPAGGGGARGAERSARGDRHAQPPAPARRPHRAHGAVGGRLTGRGRAAQRPHAAGVRLGAAHRAGRRRHRALRLRGPALRRPLPPPARGDHRRGRHRLHPARRGDGRGRLRAQLARELVGVAPAHAGRLRAHRAGGARAGPGRALQRSLPGGHGGRQARRERGVRRPGRLHRLLRRPRSARGVGDAQRVLRGGDPGRGAPPRRRDRPAHRRRDDGHLQHARRSARPRPARRGRRARRPARDGGAGRGAPRLAALSHRGQHRRGPRGHSRLRRGTQLHRRRRHRQRGQPAAGSGSGRRRRGRRGDPAPPARSPGARAWGRWSCAASATRSTPTCSRRCAERSARRRGPWPRR